MAAMTDDIETEKNDTVQIGHVWIGWRKYS